MKILSDYMNLQKEIFDYFGFIEDYVVPPIDDRREYWWRIIGGEGYDGVVAYSENKQDITFNGFSGDGDYYQDDIYTQRFYSKWVYRADDYTMIMVDTNTDNNKFLAIFNNAKEVVRGMKCPHSTRVEGGSNYCEIENKVCCECAEPCVRCEVLVYPYNPICCCTGLDCTCNGNPEPPICDNCYKQVMEAAIV